MTSGSLLAARVRCHTRRSWPSCSAATSEDPVDPGGRGLSPRLMRDQDCMRAVGAAVAGLAEDPLPAEGFHRGQYHRLRVDRYRILYVIDDDVITVERVDRVSDR
jgi:hypothetical protein